MVCGFFAVVSTFRGMRLFGTPENLALSVAAFDTAAKAIGFAILFDALDGNVARLVGSDSDFGRELDSLSDCATFGLATAVLFFFWGVMPLHEIVRTPSAQLLYVAGWVIACMFVVAGAGRLARFNLESQLRDEGHSHSTGLSIPAAAGVVAAVVHFVKNPPMRVEYGVAWLCLAVVLSFLMVSRIRYDPLAVVPASLRKPIFVIPFACLFILGLWTYSRQVLLVLAVGHSTWGPVAHVISRVQRQTSLAHS